MSAESRIQDALMRKAAEMKWSVSEVTSMLSKETGRSRDAITKDLIRLSEKKMLLFMEKRPYRSLSGYAFSPYSLWFWVALCSTLLSVALTAFSPGPLAYMRYVFGGALVLFLPGFSVVELLYAKKAVLDWTERAALSIGMSLAMTVLTALALNYTPLGIRLVPTLVSLVVLTVALLLLGVRRKHVYYKLAKGVA